MAQDAPFFAPGAYDADAEQIRRRLQLAQSLQQNQDPLQGQMVSGRYVRPSWVQGAANLLKTYAGKRMQDTASQDLQDLSQRRNQEQATDIQGVLTALRGTPGTPEQQGPQAEGGSPELAAQPGTPSDPNAALLRALSSRSPVVQQLGAGLAQSQFKALEPRVPKWEQAKIPDGKGGERVGYVDTNSANPMATFREGGVQPAKREFVNGQAVNPFETAPGTVIPKQADAANPAQDLLVPDGKGGMVPNTPLINAKKDIARSGASSTTNIVGAAEKAFAVELGKQDAEKLGEYRKASEAAQAALGTVAELRKADKAGAFSGAGADTKLAAAKWLETITGITVPGQVGSEIYNKNANELVLSRIKSLGTNPSDADRTFIKDTVPQLATSSQARKLMADFMEAKAKQAIGLYQSADKYAREKQGLGGFDTTPFMNPPTVVRTGTINGRKVVEYSDGKVDYAD